jgi:pimeloyl-ACP methyl ester carboxylesterase
LHTWEPVVERLGDRYRLISLDMPGHGLTGPSKSRDYRAKTLIKSATTVLDALGVKRATWVGSSMGGWVAWRAGLSVPERVDGLVLIGAVGAQTDQEFKPYLGARIAKSWLGGKLFPHITPEWMVHASVEESMANPAQVTDAVVARYSELLRLPGNRQAVVDREHTDREDAIWSRIGTLKVPALLIWGSEDRIVPLSFGKAFEKAIKNSTLLVMERTGHLPMEERPDDVAKAIDDWKRFSSIRKQP